MAFRRLFPGQFAQRRQQGWLAVGWQHVVGQIAQQRIAGVQRRAGQAEEQAELGRHPLQEPAAGHVRV